MLRSRDSSPHQKGNVRFVLSVPISRTKFQRGHFEPQSIKCKFVRAGLMGTWLKEESLKKRKQAFYILQICEIFEREKEEGRERGLLFPPLSTRLCEFVSLCYLHSPCGRQEGPTWGWDQDSKRGRLERWECRELKSAAHESWGHLRPRVLLWMIINVPCKTLSVTYCYLHLKAHTLICMLYEAMITFIMQFCNMSFIYTIIIFPCHWTFLPNMTLNGLPIIHVTRVPYPCARIFRLPSFPDVYSTAWLPLCISCCLQIIDAKGTRSVKIHDTCCEVVVSECGQFISGSRGMLSFRNP